VKKSLFSRKIEISQPVRDLQIQDAERKQSFFSQPAVQEYVSKMTQRSFDNGFQQGLAEGTKKKEEELSSVFSSLQSAIVELEAAKKELVEKLEPQVVDLVLRASEVVIGREILASGANLEKIIKPVLTKVPDAARIIIRVNPQDLNQLREFSNDIVEDGKIESLEVVSDANISQGGCVIDTDVGMIDATLETRIDQMKDGIKGAGPDDA